MTITDPVLTLEAIDPRSDPRWERLMTGGRGSVFGSPPWLGAIADTYGFDLTANVLVRGDEPVAGMVFADIHDLRGPRIVSLPFCDRVDPVVDDEEQWRRLVDPLLERGLPITLRCLDADAPLSDSRFTASGTAAWHGTDLTRPPEEIEAGLAPGARRNIRTARRHGVTVRIGTALEDVRAFHALHCDLRKHKYRLLAQPIGFFEHLWEQFSQRGSIAVGLASHDGDVIAGALYLRWDGVLYYKFGASLPERLNLRPNEVLAWESMLYGRDNGCHLYDWGLSDLDQPGLVAYKSKFATSERRISLLRHRPDGFDDSGDREAMALIGQLVELLTTDEVPDEVTRRAGELVYGVFA